MTLMPYDIAQVYHWSQSDIIWKQVDWHVDRFIELIENGYMCIDNGKLKKSKIVRLKPNIR